MGKGDKKSRKGKIAMGSFGVTRPKKKSKGAAAANTSASTKKAAPKKAPAAPKKAAAKKAPSKKEK